MLTWEKSILFGLVVCLPLRSADAQNVKAPEKRLLLENVWAYSMPNTRDIRELNVSSHVDLVELIQRSLGKAIDRIKAKDGFVVQGDGHEALQGAYNVLVSETPVEKKMSTHQETWIVFYTHNSMQYVHLHEVTRDVNQINIRYRFVPHDSKEVTCHFALVALGKLPAGRYTVSVSKSPLEQRHIEAGFRPIPESYVSKIVCRSFEFVVENPSD